MPGAAGFYKLLTPVPQQIADVHRQFAEVRTLLQRLPPPTGPLLADRVENAYLRFTAELDQLAVTTARRAEEALLRRYDSTRVRPDTGQQPHLRDLLSAIPVKATLATGTVGIGDVAELDRVPYWKAQEFGLSAGFVGRTLAGYFYEAGGGRGVAPDPGQFRQHPLFRPASIGSAPVMTITNPIRGGHFLEETAAEVTAAWLSDYGRIEDRALTAIAQVAAMVEAEISAARIV